MHATNLSFQQARPKEISVWLKFGCLLFEIRLYVNDDMATKGDVCVAGYGLPNTRNVLPHTPTLFHFYQTLAFDDTLEKKITAEIIQSSIRNR